MPDSSASGAASSVKREFAERFGLEQAEAIEKAAQFHQNTIHDKRGSDHFRWALCICIGYECMSRDSFREWHGITVSWKQLKPWIRDNANLAEHDGDVDYMALFGGAYNEFMPQRMQG